MIDEFVAGVEGQLLLSTDSGRTAGSADGQALWRPGARSRQAQGTVGELPQRQHEKLPKNKCF